MMRLKNREIGPPETAPGNSFRYLHSETNHWSVATDPWTWFGKITAHRKANNLPFITMEQAEAQLCETLPPEWCERIATDRQPVNTRLSLGEIFEGSKAYAKLLGAKLLGFSITVPQEEADRRGRICAGCHFRVPPQGCGACRKLAKLFSVDVAKLRSAYDSELEGKACAVCKCVLQPLVHFPLDMLEPSDTAEKQALYPAKFCWRSKASPNYQP